MESSQFTNPILVRVDGTLVRPQRSPFVAQASGGGYDEAWLQELLYKHPAILPTEEIDPAYTTLVPLCRELGTPAGSVDLVYVTPQGRLALVETKLWRNPQARREVVAQVLDYAKEMTSWEYEDLERQVIRAGRGAVRTIYELVRGRPDALDEPAFVDQVYRALKTGEFLLLIVGDGIREGVGAIAEFLDRFGSLQFTFGLLEVAVFDIPDVGKLVQPRLLAKTLIVKRTVIRIEPGSGVAAVDEAGAGEGPASEQDARARELAQFYQSYWTEFLRDLQLNDASQPLAKPWAQTNVFFPMPPSVSTAWVSAYFAQSKKQVGVYLTFRRGQFADLAWNALSAERAEIEKEIGFPLEWGSEGDGKYFVTTRLPYDDLSRAETMAAITEFFRSRVNGFVNVFRPRLERLVAQL